MDKIKITKEKIYNIKEKTIFILLALWMLMPVFLTIWPIYRMFHYSDQYYYVTMRIIAVAGIGISIINFIYKIIKAENKKKIVKKVIPIFLFILFMIWTLISCLKSPDKILAFKGTSYRKEGYFMYIIYAGFFLCAQLLESKELRRKLLNIFVIVTLYLIVASRMTAFQAKFPSFFRNNEIDTSIFAQFNHYGYYLMMSTMCVIGLFVTEENKWKKLTYLIIYIITGYALIYNNTFGCYLAICITLILYLIYSLIKKRDRLEICVVILVFIILSSTTTKYGRNIVYKNISGFLSDINIIKTKVSSISKNEESNSELEAKFEKTGTSRMLLWKNGIKFIMERPVFGYGPENLKEKYKSVSINQDRPHNLIIYISASSGIPGMIMYVTAVGIIVIKGIMRLKKNNGEEKIILLIVIAYLISSMFGNSMYYTSPYYFIFLGYLYQIKEMFNDNIKN